MYDELEEDIFDFVDELCELLNINVPSICFDTRMFPSKTTMALTDPTGTVIYIRKNITDKFDLFFAIAHEVRHVWQMRTDKDSYSKDYKPSDLCASVEDYNLQIAELDANAFATIVMIDVFGLTPLFYGLSENVKAKIMERAEYIAHNEFGT